MERRPTVAVVGVDVAPEINEEAHYVHVAGANGVVERRDAFVVGCGGVGDL